jgi:hypothetical protein
LRAGSALSLSATSDSTAAAFDTSVTETLESPPKRRKRRLAMPQASPSTARARYSLTENRAPNLELSQESG